MIFHTFCPRKCCVSTSDCLNTTSSLSLFNSLFNNHYTFFDVRRAVHCNIISIVKPTRYTNVSNLFYFGMTLYMFRSVFPSIIRSSRLYILQQAFVKQILLFACYHTDTCLLLCIQSWTPDDARKNRPKHVECHSKIK